MAGWPRGQLVLLACCASAFVAGASAWGGSSTDETPGGKPRFTTAHVREELTKFPYTGRGDGGHSFHSPFHPSLDGNPIDGWAQFGASLVTQDNGHDVVRLTNAGQGLQGGIFAHQMTGTMDINGYFDIYLAKSPGSYEPADGMGFFFSQDPPQKGSAMGMNPFFKGLGLIVDTFSNSRKRPIPYLYGYVSNGDKEWNPDGDGTDTQLTAGCQLEFDRPIRIFVQMLDLNLHVAISMNNAHGRWHTCFRYNNVPMPFSHGGYLSFAAETGHFFEQHDVRSAAFIIGDIHHDPQERARYLEEEQSRAHREAEHLHEAASSTTHDATVAPAHSHEHADSHSHTPPPSSAHATESGYNHDPSHSKLAEHVDTQVADLFHEFSAALRTSGPGSSPDVVHTQRALEQVSTVTSHLMVEVDRQIAETRDAVAALDALKRLQNELRTYTSRFHSELSKLHQSVVELRSSHDRLREDHYETHDVLIGHSAAVDGFMLNVEQARPHGFLSILIFIVLEVLLLAGFLVVFKMGGPASRGKMGRMV